METTKVPAKRLFQMLLKTPLRDLPNEVFVVLGSSDEEPFDLVIRCVRAFFREALPQLLGGSVVTHHHLSSQGRGERDRFSVLEATNAQPFKKTALVSEEISLRGRCAPPSVRTVIAAVSSNHAKAALLAVGGRIFQSFKGANPRIIDFGLPVESGLSLFLVAESEPLLRSEILDDHSQPSQFGPKSDGAPDLRYSSKASSLNLVSLRQLT